MADTRADMTRDIWLATLDKFRYDRDRPANADMWSPRLDTASRDELISIQNEKLRAAVPFLYENSPFYRRRFDRLGFSPGDFGSVDDLEKWPVVDKTEMMTDAAEHPPYGTYTTVTDDVWAKRGWMMFSSSGSTGVPRVFRYTHIDREAGAWANARALLAMGFKPGQTVFMLTGYGPHVWAWGVQYALEKMQLPTIPGGGMDARARANIILRFKPTILLCTPSYALHLGRLMQSMGHDPATTSVHTLFLAGEPALAVELTRQRIEGQSYLHAARHRPDRALDGDRGRPRFSSGWRPARSWKAGVLAVDHRRARHALRRQRLVEVDVGEPPGLAGAGQGVEPHHDAVARLVGVEEDDAGQPEDGGAQRPLPLDELGEVVVPLPHPHLGAQALEGGEGDRRAGIAEIDVGVPLGVP